MRSHLSSVAHALKVVPVLAAVMAVSFLLLSPSAQAGSFTDPVATTSTTMAPPPRGLSSPRTSP